MSQEETDEMLLAALRATRRRHMAIFEATLREHCQHETFRVQDWAFSKEIGFTCSCQTPDIECRISITDIRNMIPEAREGLLRAREHFRSRGNKRKKRVARKANARARALLHQYLTREQIRELRATKAFTVVGADGNKYLVSEGSCNNVYKLDEQGKTLSTHCVVFRHHERLPIYDLMLVQKFLLEQDVELFLETAVTTYRREPEAIREAIREAVQRIPEEEVDNPRLWVQRLRDHG